DDDNVFHRVDKIGLTSQAEVAKRFAEVLDDVARQERFLAGVALGESEFRGPAAEPRGEAGSAVRHEVRAEQGGAKAGEHVAHRPCRRWPSRDCRWCCNSMAGRLR